MIDRKNITMLSCICCTKRNRNGVIALDANILKKTIDAKGFTISNVSELLGISKSDAYRKMKNVSELTVGEVFLLKITLDLSDVEASTIFLGA